MQVMAHACLGDQSREEELADLNLAAANRIIEAIFAKAAELGLKPLGVAVADAGGHMIAAQRQDGSPFMRLEIAEGKAFGAIGFGTGTRRLNTLAQERPHFINALVAKSGGRIMPVPGGVLIRSTDGSPLGAVGVSGDTADNDEIVAMAGVEAVGFVGDGG